YGLFWNAKWKSVFEAIINLVASLLYLKVFNLGLSGVLLGTFTSNILTNIWFEPYIVYKYKFKINLKDYFIRFFKYFFATAATAIVTFTLCRYFVLEVKILEFILELIICIIVINSCYLILFYKSEEFKYFKEVMNRILQKLLKKG
ncbi:polysaccharide biosynthesis C-terminal domain-containing protein, partial [Clostridium saudiense]|nr:polysaccharide biosynthesis C-terminal domain-containing protein [Clostridium saudiense]